MNVFDFDNTIYDGESSFDFFMYCIRRKPSLIKYMPRIFAMTMKYKRGIIPESEVMKFCVGLLTVLVQNMDHLDSVTAEFWKRNKRKLKPDIMNIIHENDVIISASPSFIFNDIRDKFKGVTIISTEVDLNKAEITQLCYGANKLRIFKRLYPGVNPDNFYTDNLNDMPMIAFSKRAWLVKGNTISEF